MAHTPPLRFVIVVGIVVIAVKQADDLRWLAFLGSLHRRLRHLRLSRFQPALAACGFDTRLIGDEMSGYFYKYPSADRSANFASFTTHQPGCCAFDQTHTSSERLCSVQRRV
jgi:hypothetical protein